VEILNLGVGNLGAQGRCRGLKVLVPRRTLLGVERARDGKGMEGGEEKEGGEEGG